MFNSSRVDPISHSPCGYLQSLHCVLSPGDAAESKAETNPFPHEAYIRVGNTDIAQDKHEKLQEVR